MRVNRINYLLFIFILRQPHDPYLVDSPVCHFQYGYVEAIRDEMIAFLWHALEDPHDPSADRKDVKFFVNIELFIHLVDACRSGHEVFVFGNFLDFLYNRIMLIPALADELFEDIFHGDDTVGAAEFINDNGNMRFLRLHFFQQRADLRILGYKERRADDAA